MKIDILTLFPEMFKGFLEESIIKRAIEKGLVTIKIHDIRDWTRDKHNTVDDKPYGGGAGMVMKVDVVVSAIRAVKGENKSAKIIMLTPQGSVYKQEMARALSKESGLILLAGHYEGFDERIREYVEEEISIGDYVLTGGELPAMVVADSIVRLIPGVVGDIESVNNDSFSKNSLDYPEYTRPEEFEGKRVPEVLLSGNHGEIDKWRDKMAREKTAKRRPDLG